MPKLSKLTAVLIALWSIHTYAAITMNPFTDAIGYVNPDYKKEVGTFFENNPDYRNKAKQLGLLNSSGDWNISTAIWLDSKQAIVGYPAPRNTNSMYWHLTHAADEATRSQKPVTITFVVYDLPLRDCDAYSSNGEFTHPEDIDQYKSDYIGGITNIKNKSQNDPTTIHDTLNLFYSAYPNAKNVRTVLIIEPDSLPNMITNLATTTCATANTNKTYVTGISYALKTFSTSSYENNVYMYLDIGHSGWLGWKDNADKIAGVFNEEDLPGFNTVRGFITNTANYSPLQEAFTYNDYVPNQDFSNDPIIQVPYYSWNLVYDEISYISELMSIDSLSKKVNANNNRLSHPATSFYADKHFLIDTSRNGWTMNKTDYQTKTGKIYPRYDQRHHRGNWCNIENVETQSSKYESDRKVPSLSTAAGLGKLPTAAPQVSYVYDASTALPLDAYVWIKPPGESDGFYDKETNKGDIMCSGGTGDDHHNDKQWADSLQDNGKPAPHAGTFFDSAFKKMIDVAMQRATS